jgi:hypothetical protein
VVKVMNRSTSRYVALILSVGIVGAFSPSALQAKTQIGSDDTTTSTSSIIPEAPINSLFPSATIPVRLPNVLLVGDSTMAGLRWFKDATKSLSGASFLVDVESCRSIAGKSCYGREQRIPLNASAAIRAVRTPLDVVVLMAGTHNDPATIESELQSIKRLVEQKGAKLVVLTLRKPLSGKGAVSKSGLALIDRMNGIIKQLFRNTKSQSTYVADWKAFSAGHDNWFRQDGFHLNVRGALALGWYLSRVIAYAGVTSCLMSGSDACTIPTYKDSHDDWLQKFNVEYTETHCYEDGKKRTKMCERDRRLP